MAGFPPLDEREHDGYGSGANLAHGPGRNQDEQNTSYGYDDPQAQAPSRATAKRFVPKSTIVAAICSMIIASAGVTFLFRGAFAAMNVINDMEDVSEVSADAYSETLFYWK